MITAKLLQCMGNDLEVVKCTCCGSLLQFPDNFYKKIIRQKRIYEALQELPQRNV